MKNVGHFGVHLETGPAWDDTRPLREQRRWGEHAAFMDGLVDEGCVLLGGPIGATLERLSIVKAHSAQEVEDRLAADPYLAVGLLRFVSVEPWTILLGEPPG